MGEEEQQDTPVGAARAEHRVVEEEELYMDREGVDKREEAEEVDKREEAEAEKEKMALGIHLSLQ